MLTTLCSGSPAHSRCPYLLSGESVCECCGSVTFGEDLSFTALLFGWAQAVRALLEALLLPLVV